MLWATLLTLAVAAGPNLMTNGDVETVKDGYPVAWSHAWCRAGQEAIKSELSNEAHTGQHSLHVVHTGDQDWSLIPEPRLNVKPGDILDLSVWVKVIDGPVVLSAIMAPAKGEPTEWSVGEVIARGPTKGWRQLTTRVVAGPNHATAQPRVIGNGPVDVYVDDFTVTAGGNVEALRASYQGPESLKLESRTLSVEVTGKTLETAITDRRTGRTWRMPTDKDHLLLAAKAAGAGLGLEVDAIQGRQRLNVEAGLIAP